MAKARAYHRNKLGQFAKGGKISARSGNGGGGKAVMAPSSLGKEGPSIAAAKTATKSSGSGKVSMKIENYDGPAAKTRKR